MRRVLFISYHFPPIGGAGVQRPTKLVRYLPDFGWDPLVLTGPGERRGLWTPEDDTLARQVPASVEVRRVPGPEPPLMSSGWHRRAERWLRIRSPFSRWWTRSVIEAGRELAGEIDVICTSMAPYESAEAAAALARLLRIPWVADLRDPWALDELAVYPTSLHRRRELKRMRAQLRTARAIVMNTPEAASRLKVAFPELASRPVEVITNGFDPADFVGPGAKPSEDSFRIVHTGYLHTKLGRQHRKRGRLLRRLGGDLARVDILTRSHIYLIEAIEALLRRHPDLDGSVELHLAGVHTPSDLDEVSGLRFVHMHGYLPHQEAVTLMRSADLLFLPLHDLPPGSRATIIPGKTYDYLASGPPILGAVPEGDARDILIEGGNNVVCPPADVEAMVSALEDRIEQKRSGLSIPEPRPDLLSRFSYPLLAERLAELLDRVTESQSPVSKASPNPRWVASRD